MKKSAENGVLFWYFGIWIGFDFGDFCRWCVTGTGRRSRSWKWTCAIRNSSPCSRSSAAPSTPTGRLSWKSPANCRRCWTWCGICWWIIAMTRWWRSGGPSWSSWSRCLKCTAISAGLTAKYRWNTNCPTKQREKVCAEQFPPLQIMTTFYWIQK